MSRARTIVLAGALVCLAATLPAAAAGPNLIETSVDVGWSRSNRELAARYASPLFDVSDATLKDKDGAVVPGSKSVDSEVLRFKSTDPMTGARAPYTVTFTGVDASGSTTNALTFRVDPGIPTARTTEPPEAIATPQIVRTLTGVERQALALPPGPSPRIEGIGEDVVGPPPERSHAETSGIERVELWFYNVSTERPAATYAVAQTCGLVCPDDLEFSVQTDLGPGVWTLRAFAFDLAGNQSAPSPQLTFVVL